MESIRLIASHYGLWLATAVDRLGLEKALVAEGRAGDLATSLALKRLGQDGNPFEKMSGEELENLLDALGKLWLAMDGVWFQAVEAQQGMDGAKAVNDACWTRFAPLEARRIKAVLGLPEEGGLDALEAAFRHRFSSRINEVAIDRDAESLTLRYVNCRVQSARRRKGLADYPCKSAGVAEFEGFARGVDPRIDTACLACPPGPLGEGEFCSWRFTLKAG
nr:DUF6125 family protein [Fundidesulfovibrio terrae]